MSACASCGLQLPGAVGLCSHHHIAPGDDWHVSNRIVCDFVHRGIAPERLSVVERTDEFWAYGGAA